MDTSEHSHMLTIDELLYSLAQKRPVFHSEADFQHALAWEFHLHDPSAQIRLEIQPRGYPKGDELDISVGSADLSFALELKYIKQSLELSVGSELFCLPYHGAGDTCRHGFLKDIERLERISRTDDKSLLYALLLTNDSSFWELPRKVGFNFDAFRIHEGLELHGVKDWAPRSAAELRQLGSIRIDGTYSLKWSDFSVFSNMKHGNFRYLLVRVDPKNS